MAIHLELTHLNRETRYHRRNPALDIFGSSRVERRGNWIRRCKQQPREGVGVVYLLQSSPALQIRYARFSPFLDGNSGRIIVNR